MISDLKLALKGFCMGAADVVPGVSGGTMAFILGIYEDLIKAIRSFDLVFVKRLLTFRIKEALDGVSWRFLLALGIGILTAIFTLAKLIGYLLHNEPVLIWSFFLGLILASVITVTKDVAKWSPVLLLAALMAAAGAFFLVGMMPRTTPEAKWFVFISGAIAICAMILPGISGSFILVLLGKYHHILEAVNQRDFITLIIFAAGCGCGLALFARFLNWLLQRYRDLTIAILIGLMLGSLRKVWPFKSIETLTGSDGQIFSVEKNILPGHFNGEVMMAIGLVVLGIILVLLLERLARTDRG